MKSIALCPAGSNRMGCGLISRKPDSLVSADLSRSGAESFIANPIPSTFWDSRSTVVHLVMVTLRSNARQWQNGSNVLLNLSLNGVVIIGIALYDSNGRISWQYSKVITTTMVSSQTIAVSNNSTQELLNSGESGSVEEASGLRCGGLRSF
jgi:hypothetical protein